MVFSGDYIDNVTHHGLTLLKETYCFLYSNSLNHNFVHQFCLQFHIHSVAAWREWMISSCSWTPSVYVFMFCYWMFMFCCWMFIGCINLYVSCPWWQMTMIMMDNRWIDTNLIAYCHHIVAHCPRWCISLGSECLRDPQYRSTKLCKCR